ncbi:MAG: hypothetical protein RLZZ338_3963 [Cyanobacteriota bacterium]|jgi:hypothetical protein
MKNIISEKKVETLREKASFYGFDLIELSERSPYNLRKTRTFGLIDRRNSTLFCAYGFEILNQKIENKKLFE